MSNYPTQLNGEKESRRRIYKFSYVNPQDELIQFPYIYVNKKVFRDLLSLKKIPFVYQYGISQASIRAARFTKQYANDITILSSYHSHFIINLSPLDVLGLVSRANNIKAFL